MSTQIIDGSSSNDDEDDDGEISTSDCSSDEDSTSTNNNNDHDGDKRKRIFSLNEIADYVLIETIEGSSTLMNLRARFCRFKFSS